jgi:hypothetical protein
MPPVRIESACFLAEFAYIAPPGKLIESSWLTRAARTDEFVLFHH